jgi:hypothetical protein
LLLLRNPIPPGTIEQQHTAKKFKGTAQIAATFYAVAASLQLDVASGDPASWKLADTF